MKDKNGVAVYVGSSLRMLIKRGAGNGKLKNERKRELKMKLLRGLGLKLGFVSIFHFSFPVPHFSIIQLPDGAQFFVYLCLLSTKCDGIKYCDVFISQ